MNSADLVHHAVITGASRGIGAAIAAALAERGFRLTLMGREKAGLEARAAALSADTQTQSIACDITQNDAIAPAFAAARAGLGPITVLVNNAGAVESSAFEKTSLELWNRMLAVNLTGAFLCAQQVLPDMRAAGWGRIINIASTAGQRGYPYTAAYCAAKHGLIGMTRSLALDLAQKGITVNAVCPSYTETDLVAEAVNRIVAATGRTAHAVRDTLAASNPQHRLMRVEEVASAVAWLASDDAAAMTGQSLSVSGGEVM